MDLITEGLVCSPALRFLGKKNILTPGFDALP